MDNEDEYGLIILDNPGADKSFLANILLGGNVFVHEFNVDSVTYVTEHQETIIGYCTLSVFYIPGLIEADQTRIDLNKRETDKAFTQRPNSIILFVFGQVNGQLRGQDIAAFNAINNAYPFKPTSLLLSVNGIIKNRPSDYTDETMAQLRELLIGVNVNKDNLFFYRFYQCTGLEKIFCQEHTTTISNRTYNEFLYQKKAREKRGLLIVENKGYGNFLISECLNL